MTRENNTADSNTLAGEPDLASDLVRALIRHLDARARLLERLDILGERKHGDGSGAIHSAAKLLHVTVEGVRAVQQALAGQNASTR